MSSLTANIEIKERKKEKGNQSDFEDQSMLILTNLKSSINLRHNGTRYANLVEDFISLFNKLNIFAHPADLQPNYDNYVNILYHE